MCGICGIFDPLHHLTTSQIESDVPKMMDAIRYRGPDENGTLFDADAGVGFGHLRLSIIDLSGGHQPMSNAAKTVSLVYNGEIYNFAEERLALEKSGYRFQTRSDTEVIIALYEHYGVEAWPRLRGQFAFALWDKRQSCVYLVRDRIAEKPLVYSYHNQVLYFASELKALLRSSTVPRELDTSVLGLNFLMQHVPPPATLIKGIHKLPPGYYLKATAQGLDMKAYWKPGVGQGKSLSENQTIDQFRNLFQEAVSLCTVSDVPIGTFLSGGLDSTSVTWAALQATRQPLHTFAVFNHENHEQHPDWRYAQEAAAALKTQHHNVFYDLPELMQQIPELIEKTDEPFEAFTALVSLYLSKFTRQHVKVVLTGSGGDELLGGYQSYYQRVLKAQTFWQNLDRWTPSGLRRTLSAALGRLHPYIKRIGLPAEERRIASTLDYHARWFDLLCPGQRDVTRQRFIDTLVLHHIQEQDNYFKRFLWEDLLVNHNHAIATLPDATGMACSLEARNPFLDYKLVEFLIQVDPQLLIRSTYQNKYLLIKAMESRIPESILHRPKEGFSGLKPERMFRWIKTEGRPMFHDALLDSTLVKNGTLPKKGLEQIWKQFDSATDPRTASYYFIPIWSSTLLALWQHRHLESA